MRRYDCTSDPASAANSSRSSSDKPRRTISGSVAYSSVACCRHAAAWASVRAAGAAANSSSSARCTSEPLVMCGLGASGSFSMLEKRNAMGHEVNDSTRLGDRLVGTGYMRPS